MRQPGNREEGPGSFLGTVLAVASIGRWKTPIIAGTGGCLGTGVPWFYGVTCPDKLQVYTQLVDTTSSIDIDFAGRGKSGLDCAFSDSYVSADPGSLASNSWFVDVWKAYRDGIWTSSTTIKVYRRRTTSSTNVALSMTPVSYGIALAVKFVDADVGAACPTTLRGTITITDTGGVTLA